MRRYEDYGDRQAERYNQKVRVQPVPEVGHRKHRIGKVPALGGEERQKIDTTRGHVTQEILEIEAHQKHACHNRRDDGAGYKHGLQLVIPEFPVDDHEETREENQIPEMKPGHESE